MKALSASALADLAGTTAAEVQRMVDLGVLVARDGTGPFLETDVQKVRIAAACERAGLPMEGIAAVIRAGRLSFAFLEASPYQRWAVRSTRTYRQVSQETGVPLDTLGSVLEAMGFARMAPDEPIREDELEIVPLLQLARSTGILDPAWLTRLGRAYAEGLRLAANVENEAYRARFTGPVRASGADQQTIMELASQLAADFLPLVDRALMAIYRRQQELVWTEDLVEDTENELERAGALRRPERVPAMAFLDLGRLHPADRGTRRPGGRRVGRDPDRAGRPVLARARRGAGEVVGRRSDVPLSGARRRGAGGAGDGRGTPRGGPAAGPCRGRGGAGGGPGRRLLRPYRQPGRPDRRPRRRGAGPGQRARGQVGLPEGVAFVDVGEVQLKGFPRSVRLLEAGRE